MKRLADGLYQLRGFPPQAINVYLMGDVIVDAATRHAGRRILRQVAGHREPLHAGILSGPRRKHGRAWASEDQAWRGRRAKPMSEPLASPRTKPGEGLQPPK